MKTAFKRFMLATAVAGMLTLCACSAGGGDGGGGVAGIGDVDGALGVGSRHRNPSAISPGFGNRVTGIASKGPLSGSSICAYAIAQGVKAGQFGPCATSNASGGFSIDLETYIGPVLLEATGGSYGDEASGACLVLSVPLHGILLNATGGTASVAVTALTELAYRYALAEAGGLTAPNIQVAFASVQRHFGVLDIAHTQPVDALKVPTGETYQQKAYALALATVSQVAQSRPAGASLAVALDTMQACLAAPGLACGAEGAGIDVAIAAAVGTFLNQHPSLPGFGLWRWRHACWRSDPCRHERFPGGRPFTGTSDFAFGMFSPQAENSRFN